LRVEVVAALIVVAVIIAVGVYYGFKNMQQEVEAPQTVSKPVVLKAATLKAGISLLDVVEKDPNITSGEPVSIEVVRLGVPPQVVDALVKGDVDIAILPVELGGKAIVLGADAYIAAIDYDMNQAILTMPGSGIEKPEDLRGRKVAAVVGSGTYAMFKGLMESVYGLTVGEGEGYDVQVVNLAPPQVIDALVRGDVDAAVIWEPLVSQAIVQHGAVVVATLADLWREYIGDPNAPAPMLAWVVSGRVAENQTLLNAILEIHRKAAEKWVGDRDWTVSILEEIYNLPGPVAESVWERSIVHSEPCIDEQTAQLIVKAWEVAVKAGYMDKAPSPDRIITCQG